MEMLRWLVVVDIRLFSNVVGSVDVSLRKKSTGYRHAAREWRHPDGREAILGHWIPAIHAGMT